MTTSHRERIQACLHGEIVDHPPVALWRHFPVDDQAPDTLAAATLHFQKTYDFDIVKVTPASSFCIRDWGVEDVWEGHTEGTRRYTGHVVQDPNDWEMLPILEPTAPHLSAQLVCLRQIRAGLGPDVPILQTVFSPLAQAKNLIGREKLLDHIRKYPEAVQKGLETIAQTTRRFIESVLTSGVDGVFYAVQHAQAGLLTLDEYKNFGLPFDKKVLEPTSELWCNMLHLHGRDVHFEIVKELDMQIVNWHDREAPPILAEAQKVLNSVVCGGLRQDTLVYWEQSDVREEAMDAIAQTNGQRFILSTGCVVPVIAPHGNLMAARRSVNES